MVRPVVRRPALPARPALPRPALGRRPSVLGEDPPPAALDVADLQLPRPVAGAMRRELGTVAERVVGTIVQEVPSYSEPFRGRMGRNIEAAVSMALGGFIDLASQRSGPTAQARVSSVFEAAYELGRGEARAGRSMDALASAYRVGARTAWHDLSRVAVEAGLPAQEVAHFAELVFDYIDRLSDVSVSGHADELATAGRAQERQLERLASLVLAGAAEEVLVAAAEQAAWPPPRTLTAVVLPTAHAGATRALLDPRTLEPREDVPGLEGEEGWTVLLVPDADDGPSREALRAALRRRDAVVGPARRWVSARSSLERALAVRALGGAGRLVPAAAAGGGGVPVLDSEEHLAELVLSADLAALADLRARVLAPLADLRPATQDKLRETLRAWLLHQGRREQVAEALFVHPQTVRYRMGQLRELYGERLEDPRTVLELVVALGLPGDSSASSPSPS